MHLIVHQFEVLTRERVDGFEARVDGSVARHSVRMYSAFRFEGDERGGGILVRGDLVVFERVYAFDAAAERTRHKRVDVAPRHFLFAVGEVLVTREISVHLFLGEGVAHFFEKFLKRVFTAVFSEKKCVFGHSDVFRTHNFVGRLVGEHAVLVYAGFVRESVLAHHGFVGGQLDADYAADQLRRAEYALRDDVRVKPETVAARAYRHHDFFHRGVARALSDAVHGALNLRRPRFRRGERIRHRHSEVVVAVHRDVRFVYAFDVCADVINHFFHFRGSGISHRVGEVECGRARFQRGARGTREKFVRGARRVLEGKLHVVHEGARVFRMSAYHIDCRVFVDAQFVFEVYGRSGEKDVQTGMRRVFHGFVAFVYVFFAAAAERGDRGAFQHRGNFSHRFEFALARGGEAGFDYVHAHSFQRFRHVEFFVEMHTAPRRLFAVAQGGVEYFYFSYVVVFHKIVLYCSHRGGAAGSDGLCEAARAAFQRRAARARHLRDVVCGERLHEIVHFVGGAREFQHHTVRVDVNRFCPEKRA